MTVNEIDTKKTNLEAEMSTALEAAKVLTPATPEFDEAYQRYLSAKSGLAKIPDEIKAAKLEENKEAIIVAGTSVAEAIGKLVEGLKVAELLGTSIVSLRYAVDGEGKSLVVFNPIIKVSTPRKDSDKKGGGRTSVVDSEGNKLSLTKFVLAHATEAEKASPEFKYPHVQVDTKPKFEAFCTGHSLTGYTYVTPEAPDEADKIDAS